MSISLTLGLTIHIFSLTLLSENKQIIKHYREYFAGSVIEAVIQEEGHRVDYFGDNAADKREYGCYKRGEIRACRYIQDGLIGEEGIAHMISC